MSLWTIKRRAQTAGRRNVHSCQPSARTTKKLVALPQQRSGGEAEGSNVKREGVGINLIEVEKQSYVADPDVGKKFFFDLLLEGKTAKNVFHDSGAEITMIGREYLESLVPAWSNLPDTEPIRVNSHSNHSLPVVAAKWMRIGFPGSEFHTTHKVTIEEADVGLSLRHI